MWYKESLLSMNKCKQLSKAKECFKGIQQMEFPQKLENVNRFTLYFMKFVRVISNINLVLDGQ